MKDSTIRPPPSTTPITVVVPRDDAAPVSETWRAIQQTAVATVRPPRR